MSSHWHLLHKLSSSNFFKASYQMFQETKHHIQYLPGLAMAFTNFGKVDDNLNGGQRYTVSSLSQLEGALATSLCSINATT